MRVKVIIDRGIITSVLTDGQVDVEIVDIDPDYSDYEALEQYRDKLYEDPSLKESEYTLKD